MQLALEPSILVIPVNTNAAEALFNAIDVVPIYIVELLAALSPVLAPLTDTAPAPIVNTEVFKALPVKVTVPVFTVRAVVNVAPVTAAAVPPDAKYAVDAV